MTSTHMTQHKVAFASVRVPCLGEVTTICDGGVGVGAQQHSSYTTRGICICKSCDINFLPRIGCNACSTYVAPVETAWKRTATHPAHQIVGSKPSLRSSITSTRPTMRRHTTRPLMQCLPHKVPIIHSRIRDLGGRNCTVVQHDCVASSKPLSAA